jgi:hypothetical protein
VEVYKEIVYRVVAVDFPWAGVDAQIINDFENRIEAGVYFSRQVAKVYEFFEGAEREPLEKFILAFFPKL